MCRWGPSCALSGQTRAPSQREVRAVALGLGLPRAGPFAATQVLNPAAGASLLMKEDRSPMLHCGNLGN